MIMTVTTILKVTIFKGEQEVEEIKMKITLFMLYFIFSICTSKFYRCVSWSWQSFQRLAMIYLFIYHGLRLGYIVALKKQTKGNH